jgi:hypothetical protein
MNFAQECKKKGGGAGGGRRGTWRGRRLRGLVTVVFRGQATHNRTPEINTGTVLGTGNAAFGSISGSGLEESESTTLDAAMWIRIQEGQYGPPKGKKVSNS